MKQSIKPTPQHLAANPSQLRGINSDNQRVDASLELLSLENVSYEIGPQRLVSHINIDIAVNETLSLIGPNGAGKSTLVKLILGLLKPSKGQIITHQPLRLGYVPQRFAVPPILPLRVKDLLGQADQRRLSTE